MGTKGAKLSEEASRLADQLVAGLQVPGGVNAKKMFGGYGLFNEAKMFGLISSDGQLYLKVKEGFIAQQENIGAEKYGKMPYYFVPEKIISHEADLRKWAEEAIRVSKS